MALFDGLADALGSVPALPPDRLSFSFDELTILFEALNDYSEKLEKYEDDPSIPISYGY